MKLKRAPGVTFVEILVAMGIFLLIMGLCTTIFFSSWRRYNTLNVVQEVHSNALLGMQRFSRDFSETAMMQVVNETKTSRRIYFPSKRDRYGFFDYNAAGNSGGISPWKSWIIYFLRADPNRKSADNKQLYFLMRIAKEMNRQPTPSEVESFISTSKDSQIITKGVRIFIVDKQHTGEIETFKAILEVQGEYQGKKCSYTVEKVFLLNTY